MQIKQLDRRSGRDVSKYYKLIRQASKDLTSLEKTMQEVVNRNDITLICEIDNIFVGCCKIIRVPKQYFMNDLNDFTYVLYFGGMFVLPEYRGQGISKLLNEKRMDVAKYEFLFTDTKEIYAEILGNGEPNSIHREAYGAYKQLISLGFKETGIHSLDEDKGIILVYKS